MTVSALDVPRSAGQNYFCFGSGGGSDLKAFPKATTTLICRAFLLWQEVVSSRL